MMDFFLAADPFHMCFCALGSHHFDYQLMVNCLLCVEVSHEHMWNLSMIVHEVVIRAISLILLSFLIVLYVPASILE